MAGNVDTLAVELHAMYAAGQRAGGSVTLDVRAVVGGVTVNGPVRGTEVSAVFLSAISGT